MHISPDIMVVEAVEDFVAYEVAIPAGTQLFVTGDLYRVCSDDEVCVLVPGSEHCSVGVPRSKVIAVI